MPSTFPTTDDVAELLTAAGQVVGDLDLATPLAATIAGWGTATGWNPFALASSSTRYYDAPVTGYLELPGYAAITAVATGVEYDTATGAPGAGTAQVANVGYYPFRWRDGDTATPIVALDLCCGRTRYLGSVGRRSIAVTGTLGWPSIPDDVYSAILEETARRAFGTTQAALSGGVAKVTIGGRTVEFDSSGASGIWGENFRRTVRLYRRAVVA